MLEAMGSALTLLLSPDVFFYLLLGVLIGLAVGITPGLGGPSGLALILPFTLVMDTPSALAMIIGLGAAGGGIDSVPAILFGIPGSNASQATVLDGHPLALKGQAGRAFGAVYMSSMLGGLIGAAVLTALIPIARPVVLTFGVSELLMLGVLGIVMTATISGNAPAKGILAGTLGAMLAMVGLDSTTATHRWTFDSLYLWDGIPLVIIGLGIFALPEIADLMIKGTSVSEGPLVKGSVLEGVKDAFRHWFLVVRTALLGVIIGIIPGLGGSVVDWFAYGHARSTEKGARETFGKGDIRGVIGVDAAQNAKDGGSLVPTLLFGIPGSLTMALMLVVFVVHGIQPGPAMVTDHLDLTLLMTWSLILAFIITAAICLALAPQIAKIARMPAHVVAPIVVAAIAFAAVNSRESGLDLVVLFILGTLGWIMKRLRWPRPPLVIGFVLTPIIERYMYISTDRYGAAWLGRPGVLIIAALAVGLIAFEMRSHRSASLADRLIGDQAALATVGASQPTSSIHPGGGTGSGESTEPAAVPEPSPGVGDDKPERVRFYRDPEFLFTLLFGAILVVALTQTLDWRLGARLMPQVVIGAALLVIVFRLGGRLLGLTGPGTDEEILDLPLTTDVPPAEYAARSRGVLLWIGGFLLLGILVGLAVAIPAFLLAYLLVRARIGLWRAALITAIVCGLILGVFGEIVGIQLPDGMLFE